MTPALFYLTLAVALIGTELLIMQFSVFWFLFFGIGALCASLVAWALPGLSIYSVSGIFLIGSIASAALLYPALKKWQDQPSKIAGHDAIGQKGTVLEDVTANSEGKVQWSGSDWPARLDNESEPVLKGEMAIIKKLEGIRLIVGRC